MIGGVDRDANPFDELTRRQRSATIAQIKRIEGEFAALLA